MNSATNTTSSIESLVSEVADQFTEEVNHGRTPSIEDYAAAHPEIATIIRQVFPALALLNSTEAPAQMQGSQHDAVIGELGDYRILREIGRGGMGIVYRAEQRSIGRQVALKVLPFAAMLDKQQLNRFKNEARAAGTLDHPNIVSVFSVGTERGVHYYAMQLVEGRSLAEVVAERRRATNPLAHGTRVENHVPTIEKPFQSKLQHPESETSIGAAVFHESAIPNPHSAIESHPIAALSTVPASDARHYFCRVAKLGIQAAEALDHAHQNGIVHRDIKPANLLIDDDDKLWITDFGLARIEADAGMTISGDLLGTLRYMSPEQAVGKRTVIDPRSDVYSLGATLYELLTLRPAFEVSDRQQILHQIAHDHPPKPRQLNSRIPADLETIVTKALEKDPADRYQSAADLAADLRAFVEDRAINARPPSVATRAKKWVRRHSMGVTVALGVMLLAIAGLTVATVMIGRERAAAIKYARQAVKNAQQADKNYRLALDAVDQMLARVGDEKLKHIPLMEEVRRELLNDAVELYQQFLHDDPDDPRVRVEMGIVHQRLAKLLKELGRRSEAEDAVKRSIKLLDAAAAQEPDNDDLQIQLARSLITKGSVRDDLDGFEHGIAILRGINPEAPFARDASVELAGALNLAANLTEKTGNREQAAHIFGEADRLFQQLLERGDKDVELQRAYAKLLMNHGLAIGRAGDWQAEQEKHQQARQIGQQLVHAYGEAEDQHIYGSALLNSGTVKYRREAFGKRELKGKKDYSAAAKDFEAAAKIYRKLVTDYPKVVVYRERLSGIVSNLVGCYANDPERFVPLGEESIRLLSDLTSQFPDIGAYHREYGGALSNMAAFLNRNGLELDRAASLIRQAIDEQRRALSSYPNDPVSNQYLVNHHIVLAEVLIELGGEPDELISACKGGLRAAEILRQKYPDNQSNEWAIHRLHQLLQLALKGESLGEAAATEGNAL